MNVPLFLVEEDKTERRLEIVLDVSAIDPTLEDIIVKAHFNRQGCIIDQAVDLQWFKDRKFTYQAFLHMDKAGENSRSAPRMVSFTFVTIPLKNNPRGE